MNGSKMRRLGLVITAATFVATLLNGCATVAEKNTDQCEQAMQSRAEPALVSITRSQASPDGRTVIASGMVEDRRNSTVVPAQAECQFNGKSLSAFRWLAPANPAARQ
jgi:hypothetical protein